MANPLVLIAEDHAAIAMLYTALLEAEHYRFRLATRAADGLRAAAAELPSAAVIDLHLQEGDDGTALAEGLAAHGVPVIIATAYSGDLPSEFLSRVQPVAVLQKPFAPEALLAAVQTAVAKSAH